jgi:hypothetical protein
VIGDIRYPDGQMWTLVYLKASLTGDEPTDVLEYGTRQHAFPHQSTADQFFDESQFESYRKLGVHVAKTTFALPFADEETPAYTRLDRLSDYWYPANAAIEDHFSDHATQYDELLERVRKDPNLAFIDAAFFGEAVPPGNQRDPMFLGVALLDLMQRIFIDLDLEHASDHPHNQGLDGDLPPVEKARCSETRLDSNATELRSPVPVVRRTSVKLAGDLCPPTAQRAAFTTPARTRGRRRANRPRVSTRRVSWS